MVSVAYEGTKRVVTESQVRVFSKREWSPVPSIADRANKMSIDQSFWPHGDVGYFDKHFPLSIRAWNHLMKVGLREFREKIRLSKPFKKCCKGNRKIS